MSKPNENSFWYEEPSHEGCIHKFEYRSRDLEKTQSAFQEVEVVNTTTYGKMLMLDKQVQSSEMDEFIYHESLVHPTLLALPVAAKRVFIGNSCLCVIAIACSFVLIPQCKYVIDNSRR
jgi:spermidine synthase